MEHFDMLPKDPLDSEEDYDIDEAEILASNTDWAMSIQTQQDFHQKDEMQYTETVNELKDDDIMNDYYESLEKDIDDLIIFYPDTVSQLIYLMENLSIEQKYCLINLQI